MVNFCGAPGHAKVAGVGIPALLAVSCSPENSVKTAARAFTGFCFDRLKNSGFCGNIIVYIFAKRGLDNGNERREND